MYLTKLGKLSNFWSQISKVEGVWLFGSSKDGQLRDGSDIDLAVLFAKKPSIDKLSELRCSLQKILDFDAIDLVVLNDATSILRFEAVSGKRLFCRDRHRCAAFVSLAAREYESDMAMLEDLVAGEDDYAVAL